MDVNVKALIDNIDIGIQILDRDGILQYVNDGMVRISKTPKRKLIGKKYSTFLKESQLSISEIVFKEKRQMTLFQDIELENHTFRQLITSTPVFDAEGNVCNIIAVVERLSDLEDRLRIAQNSEISQLTFTAAVRDKDHENIIAESSEMHNLLNMVRQISQVDSTILILGESGTGKEVIAQYLHACSNRRNRPMVEINCASLPEPLLEAELFGYEKGSFTGASTRGKQGLIEASDQGILFLDEINSMPLSIQSKLLRVIETKEIRRIGAVTGKKVDFRLVAATNQDLYELVKAGEFREDLYYRLNVVPIVVPPLRERPRDIIPLANFFSKSLSNRYGKIKTFSHNAYNQLLAYSWPGNVRELRNIVERLVVTTADDVMEISNIPFSFFKPTHVPEPESQAPANDSLLNMDALSDAIESGEFSLDSYLGQCEKQVLEQVLKKYKNTYKAAEKLKIGQSSVIRKKQKYHISY